MEGVAGTQLDLMLGIFLGVLGLGVLFLLPIWWRNWRVMRGANLPITDADIAHQTITRWLLLTGMVGTMTMLLLMAGRVLPFAVFMVLCVVGTATAILIAFGIDAARARRH